MTPWFILSLTVVGIRELLLPFNSRQALKKTDVSHEMSHGMSHTSNSSHLGRSREPNLGSDLPNNIVFGKGSGYVRPGSTQRGVNQEHA